MLKALGEPQRFRIFALLMAGECCVCDVEARMKLSQNLVSHHLRTLRAAGLIEFRKKAAGRITASTSRHCKPFISPLVNGSTRN